MNQINILSNIEQLFKNNFERRVVDDSCNRDLFAKEVNAYLQQLQQQGLIQPCELSSVGVTSDGKGQICVDIMRALKNLSKDMQEDICCQMLDIDRKDVYAFTYNEEGYIDRVDMLPDATQQYMEVNKDV